ncbi:MAG TPA: ABC transporter permease [Methanosarcinales archaeon]|nr:ABC transporter permease [Methanosarcinales archaeon]
MYLKLARRNLERHTFRTILAIIGIVIGVMAISSLGILGNSLRLTAHEFIGDIGNELLVFPGYESGETEITEKQYEEMRRITGIEHAIPVSSEGDAIDIRKESTYAGIYGMHGDDMQHILEIEKGHFLRGDSDNCVVGSRLADGYDLRVGSKVTIKDTDFKVVGILAEQGSGVGVSADQAVIISHRMFSKLYDTDGYDQVIVQVRNIEEVEAVKAAIENRFNRREEVVTVMAMNMVLEGANEFFGYISKFLMGIGAISLVVAGVSILNVMLMSTMERTKEIGIMKAIGASKKEIMLMFLLETVILGVFGSLIGGVLSFAGGFIINSIILKDISYLFAPSSLLYIVLGMGFGVFTGLLGGLYPAWKASRLKPLDALRYE